GLAPRALDLHRREVDAGEGARPKLERHRDEVRPRRAAELQHAAALRRCGRKPGERRDRGEVIGLALHVRAAAIGDRIVRGARGAFAVVHVFLFSSLTDVSTTSTVLHTEERETMRTLCGAGLLLAALPLCAGGFEIDAQGARAAGMGG